MATLTAISNQKKSNSKRWLIIGGAGIVVAILAAVFTATRTNSATPNTVGTQSTLVVGRGNIVSAVSGAGAINAKEAVDLMFASSGTVTQVLVEEGDTVTQGQTLAILDTRKLESQVAAAQAQVETAQAQLAQKQQGNGTPAEIASAHAAIASAQANYDKVTAGPTDAELNAAQADLASAQAAHTAAVKSSETSGKDLESLKAALEKTQVNLQQAQAAYDQIGGASNPNIGMTKQSKDLQNATIDYQQALANYQAKTTTNGPDAQKQIASAHASVASAQKRLDDLKVSDSERASAWSTLESAKANLAKLTATASANDLAIAQANVKSAQEALNQAKLNLENARLTAPFAGIVTAVHIAPGSTASGIAISIMDRRALHVDLKLNETDVVRVQDKMPVNLTIDSLYAWQAQGIVEYIAPAGVANNGVATYAVRVTLPDSDPRVKVGMTANVDITIEQKENVLVVPNAALLPQGTEHVVEIVNADNTTHKVPVEIGLSDGAQTEIISGITEGTKIIALPGSKLPQDSGLPGPF